MISSKSKIKNLLKNGEKVSFGERKKLFRELMLKARKEIEASGEKVKITGVKQEPPTKGLQYTDSDGKQTRVILPIFSVMPDALKEEFANLRKRNTTCSVPESETKIKRVSY